MKRFALLLMGFAGSVLTAALLYVSVCGISSKTPAAILEIPETFSLPGNVPGTDLIIQRISAYEGPFLEDGTDREVVDIAALHLYNPTKQEIKRIRVVVYWGYTPYLFYGEHIPPDATVVLLEWSANPYRSDTPTACIGWQELSDNQPVSGVVVSELSMGTIAVTNITDQPMQNICLYYKTWLSPPGFYIGGITYSTHLPMLHPGQTDTIQPYHYAKGYSKIISITAEQ